MHAETVERMKRPEPYLRGPEAGRTEKDGKLPGENDGYQAAGLPDNHEVSRLVLVMGREGFKHGAVAYVFLQYVHIGIGELGFTADGGQFFRFLFSDLQPKQVTVHGRNLQRICDYIGLRRMPWIRQADRDFRAADETENSEPIITRIEIVDWKRPPEA